MAEIGPSILLTSLSEICCFSIGKYMIFLLHLLLIFFSRYTFGDACRTDFRFVRNDSNSDQFNSTDDLVFGPSLIG